MNYPKKQTVLCCFLLSSPKRQTTSPDTPCWLAFPSPSGKSSCDLHISIMILSFCGLQINFIKFPSRVYWGKERGRREKREENRKRKRASFQNRGIDSGRRAQVPIVRSERPNWCIFTGLLLLLGDMRCKKKKRQSKNGFLRLLLGDDVTIFQADSGQRRYFGWGFSLLLALRAPNLRVASCCGCDGLRCLRRRL